MLCALNILTGHLKVKVLELPTGSYRISAITVSLLPLKQVVSTNRRLHLTASQHPLDECRLASLASHSTYHLVAIIEDAALQ